MFEQLLTIGQLLMTGLSQIRLSRDKRKLIAKNIASLYHDLSILLENGNNILRLFMQHNKGKIVDIDDLKGLLEEQHILIPRITSILRRKEMKTILSIRAPQITPLEVLLFAKGSRVKFYLENINETERRHADSTNFRWISPHARIEFPDNNSIQQSRKQLRKIRSLTEELRKFIIANFKVHEII